MRTLDEIEEAYGATPEVLALVRVVRAALVVLPTLNCVCDEECELEDALAPWRE